MNRTVLTAMIALGLIFVGLSLETTSEWLWPSRVLGIILLIVAVAGLAAQMSKQTK